MGRNEKTETKFSRSLTRKKMREIGWVTSAVDKGSKEVFCFLPRLIQAQFVADGKEGRPDTGAEGRDGVGVGDDPGLKVSEMMGGVGSSPRRWAASERTAKTEDASPKPRGQEGPRTRAAAGRGSSASSSRGFSQDGFQMLREERGGSAVDGVERAVVLELEYAAEPRGLVKTQSLPQVHE